MAKRVAEHPLTGYVRQLAAFMGLGQFHVTVKTGETETEDAFAENVVWEERYRGDITISQNWKSPSRDELREVLVHELLHLHFADLDHAFYATKPLIGRPAYEVAVARYRGDREKTVQQIARFWAPHLPLPPKVAE